MLCNVRHTVCKLQQDNTIGKIRIHHRKMKFWTLEDFTFFRSEFIGTFKKLIFLIKQPKLQKEQTHYLPPHWRSKPGFNWNLSFENGVPVKRDLLSTRLLIDPLKRVFEGLKMNRFPAAGTEKNPWIFFAKLGSELHEREWSWSGRVSNEAKRRFWFWVLTSVAKEAQSLRQ